MRMQKEPCYGNALFLREERACRKRRGEAEREKRHAEEEKLKGAATLIPTKEEKEESTILGFRVTMKIARLSLTLKS